MKKSAFSVLLVIALVLVAVFSVSTAQDDLPYDGVELDILTFTGPQIAEPLQRRAPDFQELTGAQVNIITVPFAELYQSILTDQATGTLSFDGFVFAPQWMVDYIVPGFLEDLTPYVEA
ncbi:MAG: extracellular solute-binding protein, partial [Aggregatilineales bacterium]